MTNRDDEILKSFRVALEVLQEFHSRGRRSQPSGCSGFAGIHDCEDNVGKVGSVAASVRCGKKNNADC